MSQIQTPSFKPIAKDDLSFTEKQTNDERLCDSGKENIYSSKLFDESQNLQKYKNTDEPKKEENGLTKRMNDLLNYKSNHHSKISCSTNLCSSLNINFNTPEKEKSNCSLDAQRNLQKLFQTEEISSMKELVKDSDEESRSLHIYTNMIKLQDERPSLNLGESRRVINNIHKITSKTKGLNDENDKLSIVDDEDDLKSEFSIYEEYKEDEGFPDDKCNDENFKAKYCKEIQLKMGRSAYKSTSKVDSILNFTKRKSEVEMEVLKFPILANRKSVAPSKIQKSDSKKPSKVSNTQTQFKIKAHSLKKSFSGLYKLKDFNGNDLYYRYYRDIDIGIKEKWQTYRIETEIDEDAPSDSEQIDTAVKHINKELKESMNYLIANRSLDAINNRKYFEFYKSG